MNISFVLLCEGSSDAALVEHLRELCLACGCRSVRGAAIDFRRLPDPPGARVIDKLRRAVAIDPEADVFFVHRDADGRDAEPRRTEIGQAAHALDLEERTILVVPVQETEAWLLLDEGAIRKVVNRQSGRRPLGLPTPQAVESCADPKKLLREGMLEASETSGRRRKRIERNFSSYRRRLLERLPVGGPLEQVESWVTLRRDVQRWVDAAAERAG